ncbi:MAG: hypothetical protein ACFFD2_15710 [Promethearchaeota archaeon]
MIQNLNSFFDNFPEDLFVFFRGLRTKFRTNLALLLLAKGPFSLSGIAKSKNIKSGYLVSQLKELELSGIVQNYIEKRDNVKHYLFYEITSYGARILNVIIKCFSHLPEFKDQLSQEEDLSENEKLSNELELLFKGLSNKFRIGLLLYLYNIDAQSFSNIFKIFKKEKSSITTHLKKLEICGLIQNYFKKSDTRDYSFYEITKFGYEIISELISGHNTYYRLNSIQVKESEIACELEEPSQILEVYCSSWLLPNEPILGWIRILSEKISLLELRLSKNLRLKNIYNCDFEKKKNRIISIKKTPLQELTYISFKLFSDIPEGDHAINLETITVSAYNKDTKLVLKKEMKVEIVKPIVKLEVIKKDITSKSGFFELRISMVKGFEIKIPTIEFKVEDKNGNKIYFREEQKDPTEIAKKTLPGVELENLVGAFEIKSSGPLYFYFRIPYIDANNNNYYSNEEKIEIYNKQIFEGNLDYHCNFIQEVAVV